MTAAEREAFLDGADTGILTTLRRDGSPVSLPMWFVVIDGDVHSVPVRRRARRHASSTIGGPCFVVDTGAAWVDLAAVVISGTLEHVIEADAAFVEEMLNAKYRDLGVPDGVPTRTMQHYADPSVYYRGPRPPGAHLGQLEAGGPAGAVTSGANGRVGVIGAVVLSPAGSPTWATINRRSIFCIAVTGNASVMRSASGSLKWVR